MARVIDFRTTGWGHNLDLVPLDTPDDFKGAVWSTPRPSVGDKLVWRTAYGHLVAEVTEVDYCRDPSDMCFLKGKILERVKDE